MINNEFDKEIYDSIPTITIEMGLKPLDNKINLQNRLVNSIGRMLVVKIKQKNIDSTKLFESIISVFELTLTK